MLPEINQYYRTEKLPHIWCPGCGNGIVLRSVVKAIETLKLNQNNTSIVSGIGCSSRAAGYLDFDTLHTTHGRALAFATGVKLAKPELNVLVLMGDGDSSAIGGNHLIHAARRNINLTAVIFNNNIYGMTGGQCSPMTPTDKRATTSPYGNLERSFNLVELVKAAGATFVGRSTAFHHKLTAELVAKGIQNQGFSFIEVITQCPIAYGKKNKMGQPDEMLKWQRDHAVRVSSLMDSKQLEGKFLIGELHNSPAPEFTQEYDKLISKFSGKEG